MIKVSSHTIPKPLVFLRSRAFSGTKLEHFRENFKVSSFVTNLEASGNCVIAFAGLNMVHSIRDYPKTNDQAKHDAYFNNVGGRIGV